MPPTGPGRVRRVLVALDASPTSISAAMAAARAAKMLEAEFVGLFVEDLELLQLSRSPLAQRGDLLSPGVRRLEIHDMELEMRVQAVRAERSLTEAARRAGIACSFTVTRGPVADEILAMAGSSDLVSMGRTGWTVRPHLTLGRTARALLSQPGKRTLFVERSDDLDPPHVVLFDGSRVGCEALDEAVGLARPGDAPLVVMLLGSDADKLRRRAVERLGDGFPAPLFHDLRGRLGCEGIARVVERLAAGLLVVPIGDTSIDVVRLQTLLLRVDCPILVVS